MSEPEKSATTAVADPYDEVPYEGHAIPLTHPSRLALAAIRAGLDPAPPEACRVLELGCAEAVNLAAMAFHLEGSRFLGVDASAQELERARETRDRLGLDNLELRNAPIEELGEELGKFDYVICHGVLSWVAEPVRRRIFALCAELLSPQGVAYLSYNCTPGWALKSQLRRALLQRVRGVDDPDEKVRRLRELLTLFASSPLKDSLQGGLLAEHAARALTQRDQYLLHEYLAPINHALTYGEFVALAAEHHLDFVVELGQATRVRSLEEGLRKGLLEQLEDPLEAEDLADLMLSRAFRASMVCLAGAPRLASPLPALARRGTFAGQLSPRASRPSVEPGVNEVFLAADGSQISAHDAPLKAALLELGRAWPRGLRLDQLGERAELLLELRRVLEPGRGLESEALGRLCDDLLELERLGHLELRPFEPPIATEVGLTPRVAALTRLEAARGPLVTSPHHRVIQLDPFTRFLVRYLDGSRDREALLAPMRRHFDAQEITAHDEQGQPLEDAALLEALPGLVDDALSSLSLSALLAG